MIAAAGLLKDIQSWAGASPRSGLSVFILTTDYLPLWHGRFNHYVIASKCWRGRALQTRQGLVV